MSLLLISTMIYSQNWLPMDKGIDCFYHGDVKKIVVDSANGKLYISGMFSQGGDCTYMYGAAAWDGVHWDSLGNSTQGSVKEAISMYNDSLFAWGNFYIVNSNEYLAKWTGSFWDTIPNGPNNSVTVFLQTTNMLYMGGGFDHLGNDSTFLLGKYDGHQFSAMTPYYGFQGIGNGIYALAFFQDTLYVGGKFGMQPYKDLSNFAKWDGSDLQVASSEFANTGGASNIYTLAVYHNELYLGGYFRKVDGYTGDYIMKWDGHQLTEVGTGMNDIVTCMKVYHDQLYVAGSFTNAGGVPANYVARWDGTNWNTLSSDTFTGSYPMIRDLNVYKDSLIIAGTFTAINGDTRMKRVAKYSQPLIYVSVQELNQDNTIKLFPTLTQSIITIELSELSIRTTAVQIKNTLAQTIKTFQLPKGNKQLEMDISELSKGLYFVQLQSEDKIITKKFIKQ